MGFLKAGEAKIRKVFRCFNKRRQRAKTTKMDQFVAAAVIEEVPSLPEEQHNVDDNIVQDKIQISETFLDQINTPKKGNSKEEEKIFRKSVHAFHDYITNESILMRQHLETLANNCLESNTSKEFITQITAIINEYITSSNNVKLKRFEIFKNQSNIKRHQKESTLRQEELIERQQHIVDDKKMINIILEEHFENEDYHCLDFEERLVSILIGEDQKMQVEVCTNTDHSIWEYINYAGKTIEQILGVLYQLPRLIFRI